MLRLPDFAYVAPRSLSEAVQALAEGGPGALLLAGGTDLVPNLKRRQFPATALISLKSIPDLETIRTLPTGELAIGALTSLQAIAGSPLLQGGFQALAQAAAQVATPAIRNAATLGGNLMADTRCQYYNQTDHWREALGHCMKCDPGAPCRVAPGSTRCMAVSSSDTAPALIALSARVRLLSPRGLRELPLEELYQEDGIAYCSRAPDEILTEVLLPPCDGLSSTYLKLRRRGAFDFPILGVAAVVAFAPDGRVSRARLCLGAAASCPVLVPEAQSLVGSHLAEQGIMAVARAAAGRARPMDHADLTVAYRKRMAQVFTARALRALAPQEPHAADT